MIHTNNEKTGLCEECDHMWPCPAALRLAGEYIEERQERAEECGEDL